MLRFGQIIQGLPSQELTVEEVEDKEARAVVLEVSILHVIFYIFFRL